MQKQKLTIKDVVLLQGIVIIYTMSQVMQKCAALQELFSVGFLIFYGLEFVALFVYAICWQQMIKRFELSIAYANRAVALLWALVWSVLLFQESLTIGKVLGVCVVLIGVMIINGGKEEVTNEL
ncbi:MAG: EamA family transporter [Eubacteriales bacterium]